MWNSGMLSIKFLFAALPYMSIVVRRVVMLGIARGQLNIRFGHCASCLFDNSSVKLCKARHAVLFAPLGANHEQGLGVGPRLRSAAQQ